MDAPGWKSSKFGWLLAGVERANHLSGAPRTQQGDNEVPSLWERDWAWLRLFFSLRFELAECPPLPILNID
jgi:hypothetical protein